VWHARRDAALRLDPEVIDHGKTGFVCDDDEEIALALRKLDRPRSRSLSRRGRHALQRGTHGRRLRSGVSTARAGKDVAVDDVIRLHDRYYILATSGLSDDRTRVLKHGDTFAVFDRHGDVQPIGLGQQGVFDRGTRGPVAPSTSASRARARCCSARRSTATTRSCWSA
jgi:hypothetical protein